MGKKSTTKNKYPERKHNKSKKSKKSKYKSKNGSKCRPDGSEQQLQQQRAAVHTFRLLLSEYPQAKKEFREMIWKLDDGEAVDVDGMPDATLRELLKEMFIQLGLKQLSKGFCRITKGDKIISILAPVFELPGLQAGSAAAYLASKAGSKGDAGTDKSLVNTSSRQLSSSPSASASDASGSDPDPDSPAKPAQPAGAPVKPTSIPTTTAADSDMKQHLHKVPEDAEKGHEDEQNLGSPLDAVRAANDMPVGSRRALGPSMPDAEVLAAAREAAAEFEATGRVWRPEGEREEEDELLIGPAPPEMAEELGDVPQDERSQEVKRIMSVSGGKHVEDLDAYEVLGVNAETPVGEVKRRYWKLSLLIHPDKCHHPQADEAFKRLSLAAKVLQNASSRSALDHKRMEAQMQKWEQEEADQQERERQWRVVRGEEPDTGPAHRGPKVREEWMLALPAERRAPAIMSQVSVRAFGRNTTSTGDASGWTRNPLEPAGPTIPALMGSGAYASTAMLMGREQEAEPPGTSGNGAASFGQSSGTKRSLLEQHQEEVKNKKKKKDKDKTSKPSKEAEPPDADWVGQHPWRPFDREKDLGPSLGKAKNAKELLKGVVQLSSRFASGGSKM